MNAEHLATVGGLCTELHSGFAHDKLRTQIGQNEAAFRIAIQAFKAWKQFDLGWARVANPLAQIATGQIVAVEVHSLGLWSLNLSQIVEVVQTASCFGFIYKTTKQHVEEGEERFLLTLEKETGAVWYETEAISRPRGLLTRLGYPVTRTYQHRFARESHRRMVEHVSALPSDCSSNGS
ncbi:MAG TPA: DUF1990 domain-containing protein [Terracidiphilus sp.]|jgi:uncharacterized protein (UPF0548 family)